MLQRNADSNNCQPYVARTRIKSRARRVTKHLRDEKGHERGGVRSPAVHRKGSPSDRGVLRIRLHPGFAGESRVFFGQDRCGWHDLAISSVNRLVCALAQTYRLSHRRLLEAKT